MSRVIEGFPSEGRAFLAKLAKNNNRDWFQKNKKDYEALVKRPAEQLRDTLCATLSTEVGKEIQAKIFRINRDLRFSKDKTPYNTHVRMLFWSPAEKETTGQPLGAAFMLSIETDNLICGIGKLGFEKDQLVTYRKRVSDPAEAEELHALLDGLRAKGARLGDYDLTRPPAGTDKDHPFPDLLRYKGLVAWRDLDVPEKLASDDADQAILSELKALWPLYEWLNRSG